VHLQIRTAPAKSPPDLREFLDVIGRAGINILAAGGSNVEHGGEFALAVAHEDILAVLEALTEAGYEPRVVKVATFWMTNSSGQLLEAVASVASLNAASGKTIVDVSIGVPDGDGKIPVQIYSR